MGIPPDLGQNIIQLGIKLVEGATHEVKSAIEERNRKRVKIGSQTVGDIERLEKQAEEDRAIQDPLGLESEEAMRVSSDDVRTCSSTWPQRAVRCGRLHRRSLYSIAPSARERRPLARSRSSAPREGIFSA